MAEMMFFKDTQEMIRFHKLQAKEPIRVETPEVKAEDEKPKKEKKGKKDE